MAKKYGVLYETWQEDLKKGFDECWRVLKQDGVLIFKWNERDIKIKELLRLFNKEPLFGHTTRQNNQTIWLCFMKLENKVKPIKRKKECDHIIGYRTEIVYVRKSDKKTKLDRVAVKCQDCDKKIDSGDLDDE